MSSTVLKPDVRVYQEKGTQGQIIGNMGDYTLNTAGNATWTDWQTSMSILKRDTNGASRTDTTATAAQLVAFAQENQFATQTGFAWRNRIMNVSTTQGRTLTIAAGSGITFKGLQGVAVTSFDLNTQTGVDCIWRITNNQSGSEAVECLIIGNFAGSVQDQLTISAATTLSAYHSGKTLLIPASSGAYTITLPNPSTAGLVFRFVTDGALTSGAVTLANAGGAHTYGNIFGADATAVASLPTAAAPVTNVILGTSTVAGDIYEFMSDGTSYIVLGFTNVHTHVTFS